MSHGSAHRLRSYALDLLIGLAAGIIWLALLAVIATVTGVGR